MVPDVNHILLQVR